MSGTILRKVGIESMDNTNNDNDIDALQAALMEAREECVWFISPEQANDFSRVLSALLLERDALKAECNKRFDSVTIKDLLAERDALLKRVAELQKVNRTAVSIMSERDALKQRVAELESQEFTLPSDPFRDPDRDLRKRLVESALRGAGTGAARSVKSSMLTEDEADALGRQAVWMADGAFAEMRKGAANG